MANENATFAPSTEDTAERQAIRTIGGLLVESLAKISQAEQSSMVSMMAIVAVLASLPEIEKVDPTNVGTVVGLLAAGRPDESEFRTKVANVAARIITVAQQSRAPMTTQAPQPGHA